MSIATAVSQLLLLIVFLSLSEAREFLVGGTPDSWKIPGSDPDALDKWAEEFRFRIGDSLVWKYEAGKDSVLQVTKEAYLSCNTTNPIAEYNDGNTTVNLTQSGPYYFISGEPGHCEKGQKLTVIVLSTKHLRSAATPVPAPAGGPAGSPLGDGCNKFEGIAVCSNGSFGGIGICYDVKDVLNCSRHGNYPLSIRFSGHSTETIVINLIHPYNNIEKSLSLSC